MSGIRETLPPGSRAGWPQNLADIKRNGILLILAGFALIYLCNCDALGFRSEDWYFLPPFGEAMGRGLRGWIDLLHNPRFQFTTFAAQGLLIRWFGFRPLPLFVFLLGSHLLSCLLIYRMLRKLASDSVLAATVALGCLLVPTSVSSVIYQTHAFVVFPVTLLLLLAHLYMFPLSHPALDLTCLTLVALAGQFSGDQTIPLFYAVFVLAGFHAFAARDDRPRQALRAALPSLACGAGLAVAFFRFTRPFLHQDFLPEQEGVTLAGIAAGFLKVHRLSLWPNTWIFGRFSAPISWRSWLGIAALAVLLLVFYKPWIREEESPRLDAMASGRLALMAVLAVVAYAIPIFFAAMTGYRSGVMPHYIYFSGFCLVLLMALACDAAARTAGNGYSTVRRALFALLVFYLGSLMQYAILDVWGRQKRIDDRIWALIDAHYTDRVKFLVLDSVVQDGLIPDWRSGAYSDFSARGDCVAPRLKQIRGEGPVVTRRYVPQRGGGAVKLEDRFGRRYAAKPNEILAVVFRYYGRRFNDLDKGYLRVFPDFGQYLRFRKAEQVRFFQD